MKKSSRDYRKNRRKKWIRINLQYGNAAFSAVIGAHAISIIQNNACLTNEEKAIKIAQQAIHTALQVSKAFNPYYT